MDSTRTLLTLTSFPLWDSELGAQEPGGACRGNVQPCFSGHDSATSEKETWRHPPQEVILVPSMEVFSCARCWTNHVTCLPSWSPYGDPGSVMRGPCWGPQSWYLMETRSEPRSCCAAFEFRPIQAGPNSFPYLLEFKWCLSKGLKRPIVCLATAGRISF